MNRSIRFASVILGLSILCTSVPAARSANPYVGRWALTIPGGAAGWLGVVEKDGELAGSILWGGGSVVPVDNVEVEDGKLVVTWLHKSPRDPKDTSTQTITATLDGDSLKLTTVTERPDGSRTPPASFTGKRIPPLPPKPDLAKVRFGQPLILFDGKDNLDEKWTLTQQGARNGWSVENGILVNKPVQQEGQPHISYGNLRTRAEFEDFNLKLEVRVEKGQNSGVYLRGIYEVQVCDSFGRRLDSHNMGGIYSRITPTVSAEKPPGQWQTVDITLVDRHVTVKLNGQTIIDNQPLLGCTGGALWSDESRPGPLYLQGDHTAVSYRNIVLTPVIK